ncbi:MAG: hypothetical protein U5J95_12795 [Balneolaceae bacterium]|nr:hypothetical protein [Balneolaceae bacterium]
MKEQVKEYRTEKARRNLQFVQEQVQEAKKRFEEAQNRLAEFRIATRTWLRLRHRVASRSCNRSMI